MVINYINYTFTTPGVHAQSTYTLQLNALQVIQRYRRDVLINVITTYLRAHCAPKMLKMNLLIARPIVIYVLHVKYWTHIYK